MKSQARVVVIGGGVVGCSVLYHLTKAGWKDVVLVERDRLTSGSTWHAAGGFHTLNGDPNVAKLQGYTIGLYDELEKISGQACGLHRSGGLILAGTPERLEWLKMAHARARYLGAFSLGFTGQKVIGPTLLVVVLMPTGLITWPVLAAAFGAAALVSRKAVRSCLAQRKETADHPRVAAIDSRIHLLARSANMET